MARKNPILTCQEVVDLLANDLDGTLSLATSLRLKLHLFLCCQCRCFRRIYRKTVSTVHRLRILEQGFDATELPEDLIQKVLAKRR